MQVKDIDVGSRVRFVKAGSFGLVFEVVRVALNFYDTGHVWYKIRRFPKGQRPCLREYWVRDTDIDLAEGGAR